MKSSKTDINFQREKKWPGCFYGFHKKRRGQVINHRDKGEKIFQRRKTRRTTAG